MKTMKKLLTAVLAVATAALLAIPAMAATDNTTVIDKTAKGSITVHKYVYNGNAPLSAATGTSADANNLPTGAELLGGVEFTLYQVMGADDVMAYYNGTNTDEVKLSDYVSGNAISSGKALATYGPFITPADGENKGIVTFSDLPVGMYVLIETGHPANVSLTSTPSLISIPMVNTASSSNNGNAQWMYDINVYPKNSTSEGNVKIVKKDDDGNMLKDVTFQLYKDTRASGAASAVWTQQDSDAVTNAAGEINWNSLTDGDYYIVETEAPKGYIVDKRPIYFTVGSNTVTCSDSRASGSGTASLTLDLVNPKPDLDKEVQKNGTSDWVHDTQYSIGDTIPYHIRVKVPSNITELTTFTVTDTPIHLKDNAPTAITYTDGTLSTNAYSVSTDSPTNGFTITFDPAKMAAVAGKEITISYTAVLQGDAAIFGDGNSNTAKLTYSSEILTSGTPGTPGTYEIEDKDVVYTYQAQIIKHKDTASGDAMSGVEFQLQMSATGSAVTVVQIADGEYRLPVSGETGVTTTTTLKTDANGKIVIKGLENDTYYLKETKTADGYNLLSAPVKLTLNITEFTAWSTSSTFGANGKWVKNTYTSGTTTFGGNTTPDTSLYSKDVVNKKGFTLPQTGGFGTLTLSVIGCALVLGGALVLVNSKKRAK